MKKLFISLLVASIASTGLLAQEGTTFIPLNYDVVKKKVEKSDEEIQNPKKNVKAKTWFKRGELYQDVFMIGLEQIQQGSPSATVELFYKEPNKIETETLEDGSEQQKFYYDHIIYTFVNGGLQEWEKVAPIHEEPLKVAMEAYFKALELDEKGKMEDKIKENLILLKNQFKTEGINDYFSERNDEALQNFEYVLEINEKDLFAGEFDTIMVQYSGIISREIAEKTGDKDLYLKAIGYYEQLAEVEYGGPSTYVQIRNYYMAVEDTLKALEAVKEGYEKYPDTTYVIANVADTYIQMEEYEKGLEFMEEVIARNPEIPQAHYWQGRLLIFMEENEYIDKAIESYNKVIEMDPSIYFAYYDLGYIYFRQGENYYETANQEEEEEIRNQYIEAAKEKYALAIPLLEKSFELNDENAEMKYDTLDVLKRIYYKERMTEDYDRVSRLMEEM